jgi:hypothetical protein
MSKITLEGNASGMGTFTVAAPNSNTSYTLTLPQATGTLNTSGVANEVPAGSASTPSIYPTGDTNTGIFFPAADTIAFTEGGTESMRIDSSGNLGIGNDTARGRLSVSDGTINTAGEAVYQAYIVGTSRTPTSDLTAMLTIQSTNALAANVGGSIAFGGRAVSASTAGANWATIAGFKENATTSEFGGYLQFVTRPNSGAAAERARITSNGDILLGTTATWGTTNGRSVFISNNADSQTLRISNGDTGSSPYGLIGFFRNQGALIARISTDGSSVAYNTTSDYRLKENVIPMTGALEKVAQLNPVTYTWKATGKSSQGFIAHELAEVVPDCVSGDKDAVNEDGSIDPQGVDTSFLVATLTAAIQELKAELDTVKAQNAAFEARLAALEAK